MKKLFNKFCLAVFFPLYFYLKENEPYKINQFVDNEFRVRTLNDFCLESKVIRYNKPYTGKIIRTIHQLQNGLKRVTLIRAKDFKVLQTIHF